MCIQEYGISILQGASRAFMRIMDNVLSHFIAASTSIASHNLDYSLPSNRWFLQHSDAEEGKIETSYHCVYILVYLLSDGLDNWTVESISAQDVLDEVRTVMALWEVNVKRNVRYRSLLPVLALLECQSLPKEEAQYLAAWSLCNLTTVKMELYCDMLRRENGEEIIRRVCESLGDDQQKTKHLLANVMQNISKYFAVRPT